MFDNYGDDYQPIRDLVSRYTDRPVQFVGIMSNHQRKHLDVAAERGGLPWTVIPQRLNGPIQLDWGVDGYPTVYLIDQDGILQPSVGIPNYSDGYDTSDVEVRIDGLLSDAN